ncbi:patatin-like phospholipase family protein [Archangium gephyra]|uniref:patatin-like phospholipase family protein n=1 Tax=Archangium gephyra TaxID=48 RepID=UPI000649872A|nr:patatin-like phospholipase family protein [Archangium gephyra]
MLSVGGTAGLAHLGALDELRRQGVIADCVVGNSMGALVGSLYATDPGANSRLRYLKLLKAYVKQTKDEALNRGATGAALGIGTGLLLGGPLGWLALLGGALGASSTEEVSHERLQQVLDAFYHHANVEQVPIPFVTFHQKRHGQGLRLVKVSQGNLAEAVMGSTSNPFIFPDIDPRDAPRLDPGTDRVSAVPVQDACDAFPDSRLIVINVTGRSAFYARDISCEVLELRVELEYEPSADALAGYGEEFEIVYQAGVEAVEAGAALLEPAR